MFEVASYSGNSRIKIICVVLTLAAVFFLITSAHAIRDHGPGFHAGLNIAIILSATIAGILLLLFFACRRETTVLFAGIAAIGSGFLGAYQAVETFSSLSGIGGYNDNSSGQAVGGVSCFFFPIMLFVGWIYRRIEARRPDLRKNIVRNAMVIAVATAVASFLLDLVLLLPNSYITETATISGKDGIAAAFFALGLIGYLHKDSWNEQRLDFWIVLALGFGLIGESLATIASIFPESYAGTSHLLLFSSFFFVLIGGLVCTRSVIGGVFKLAGMDGASVQQFTEPQMFEEDLAGSLRTALHDETQRYAAVLGTIADSVITIDDRGIIQSFNAAAEREFGYTGSEVIGYNVKMLMPETMAVEHDGYIHSFLDTGVSKIIGIGRELTALRADGSTFDIELAISEMPIAGERMFTGVIRNISERKSAEAELTKSVSNLRKINAELVTLQRALIDNERKAITVLETIADSVITIDTHGIIQSFNLAAEREFGYTASEVVGDNVNLLMPRDVAVQHDSYIQNYLNTGESKIIGIGRELIAKRKDGTTFDIELAIGELEVAGERMFTGVIRNISERKHNDSELAQLVRNLKQSNEELERFASIASHDLKEPLRKVRAFGDRLQRKFGDALGEVGQDYIARMLSSTARMQDLIDDLLNLSRVATKGRDFVRVDLNEIVATVLSDLEVSITDNDAIIRVGELPVVHADPIQMRQLFQNLIGNAIKYRKPDVRPEVRISSQCPRSASHQERRAKREFSVGFHSIEISDNGIGFSEKYSEQIFEVFERLHSRDTYKGTGVGLAICRKIVERHGGIIEGFGEENKGAIFTIALPIYQNFAWEDHEFKE